MERNERPAVWLNENFQPCSPLPFVVPGEAVRGPLPSVLGVAVPAPSAVTIFPHAVQNQH